LAKGDDVERSSTPTLAIGNDDINIYSPISTGISQSTPFARDFGLELTFAERNLVVMAVQNQIDWNLVSMNSGVGVDKVMKWWMKASSEMVKRG
jgi:hypothetical protein